MVKLPGNVSGKFSSTKTPEEISKEITSTIVLAKKSLKFLKDKIEILNSSLANFPIGKPENLQIKNQIEMLKDLVENLENTLDQLGTFADNLEVLIENYNPNEEYYAELKTTLNYLAPLLAGLKELLSNKLQVNEVEYLTNKYRKRGDNLTIYEGNFEYEGNKFNFRVGSRKEPFQAEDESTHRQARIVFGIRDAITSNTEDVVTIRLDNNDRIRGIERGNSELEMDLTFPKSEEITDTKQGNRVLKEKINNEIYGNTSQFLSYHFKIKERNDSKKFKRFATLFEQIYLKK